MTDRELSEKLADLGARIDARFTDLKERGEFSDVHARAFAEIRSRRDALEERMEKLVAGGALGGAAAVEFSRDVDALTDGFESAVFAIDAQAVRAG